MNMSRDPVCGMDLDLVVRDGLIVDGTGAPWFKGDVAVEGGVIVGVGRVKGEAETTLEAEGLAVSPGWIDIHTHADHTVLANPQGHSYIHQGVTTVAMGNCGLSVYPVSPQHRRELAEYLKPFTFGLDPGYGWEDYQGFTQKVVEGGTSLNLVGLVGHGSIRIAVMGFEDRAPTGGELGEMEALLEEALAQGCFGMSTGLGYPPGLFAGEEELATLGKTLAQVGALYATHMRGEESNLEETLRLAERMGTPLQVSHLGSSRGRFPHLRGQHREATLKQMEEARARGVDVTADIYPYTAGSSLLSQLIPDQLHAGGVQAMLGRLEKAETREWLRAHYRETGRDWGKVLVSSVGSQANKWVEGKTLAEVGEARGVDPVDALCDLLLEEGGEAMNITFWGVEEDVDQLAQHPAVMPCSDGWSLAPHGPLAKGKPHPRCYGAFPRYLRRYVYQKRSFTLEEAVRRMTSLPASRLGLQDRGLIKVGMKADLTVFDPARVRDTATYREPHSYPEGVEHVVVNGVVTLRGGRHTGALAGRVLKPWWSLGE